MGSDVDTVRSAVAALNEGDLDTYLSAFTPSSLRWVIGIGQPLTFPEIEDSLRQLHRAFDPLFLHEDRLFGGDGFVCARWRLEGTHRGEFMGSAASGRDISVETCEVYEVLEGRVTQSWIYGDHSALFRQIEPVAGGGQ